MLDFKIMISIVSLMVIMTSFGQVKVDLLKLVVRDGISYYADEQVPFTGIAEEVNEYHTFVDIYRR